MERRYISSVFLDGEINKDSYLNNIPAIKYLINGNKIEFKNAVTFLVGENGTGKSTLTEAIAAAYGFNPEGGSRNFNFATNESHSELWENLILTKQSYAKDGYFLRAESFYNVASNIDEMDKTPAAAPRIIESYGGVSLHKQSHGEGFMHLVTDRFYGNGVYILDEPEAALSPKRLLNLICEIDRLVKAESQFIIATHSPILMAFPNAEILELTDKGINKTNFENTEHYKISKSFFEDPQRLMNMVLKECDDNV